MAATMAVFEFPPRFSLSSHVSTESRYGMKSPFFFFFPPAADAAAAAAALADCSASAEMTFPSVVRLLLMLAPSLSLVPLAPVDSARSDPARSTKEMRLTCKD